MAHSSESSFRERGMSQFIPVVDNWGHFCAVKPLSLESAENEPCAPEQDVIIVLSIQYLYVVEAAG